MGLIGGGDTPAAVGYGEVDLLAAISQPDSYPDGALRRKEQARHREQARQDTE